MVWRYLSTAAVLFVIFCSSAAAQIPLGIEQDLAPLSALVLLDRGGEVLVDLTQENGGRVGDLFSVVVPGEPLKHPETGEFLGSLDEVKGLLQIVQLRPGFSIAQRLSGDALQAGTKVHRFDRIAAKFVDSSSAGEGLFIELRAALPHLRWQEYSRVDPAQVGGLQQEAANFSGLFFMYDGQVLEVRDQNHALLHSYAVAASAAVLPQPALKISGAEGRASLAAKWLGGGAKGLPVGLAVADFDADGQLEIARAFEGRLEIGRIVAGGYSRLFSTSFPRETTAVALAAIDLNRNGRAELFLTTVKEDEVRAEVLEYTEGKYRNITQDQPWFLNSIELPGKGLVLLGQKRDRSYHGFAAEVYELEWQDQQLSPKGQLHLPEEGLIYSLAALPSAGKGRFARINSDGRIEVSSSADGALWVSDEKGHSETGFLQADARNPHWDAEFLHRVFLPPALIAGPDGSIIAALNRGRTGSDKYRQMRSLGLSAWQWRNQELQPLWQMVEMDGYVPAMTLADADNDGQVELVLLLAHPNSNIFGVRKSVIKLFQLQ